MRRFLNYLFTAVFITALVTNLLASPATVKAEAGSAYDLISAVNGLRQANGLPALEVDSILMSTAQATSDVMAASGNCAHIGNATGRIAAAGYGSGGTVFATENIACGMDLSIDTAVYTYWADATHMMPMTDGKYTHIGGGVTVISGRVFYVIHAAYTSGGSYVAASPAATNSGGTGQTGPTQGIVSPIVTVTPAADGSVIHEVQPGQALWSIAIAYGVKIIDLIGLNNLAATPVIYIGQKIIVQPSFTATISPTTTPTRLPATRTPAPSPTPKTPTVTPTPTLTPTPTPKPLIDWKPPEWLGTNVLGIGILSISAIGLVVLVVASFRKKQ